jgi:hypothetical protein
MRVPAGALTEAACSVDLAFPPSASRRRWRVARSVRCVADLYPALPGYHLRALVGRDVRGEVGPYPARRVLRDPPSAPLFFALAAPEGVYLSAVGVPISTPLLRATCPRQNAEKCRDLEKSQGEPRSMCDFKISAGPRHAQTAAENCRGVGAFLCVVLGSNSGLTMCKTHPDKT